MKKTLVSITTFLLLAAILLSGVSCSFFVARKTSTPINLHLNSTSGLWQNAFYIADSQIGQGMNKAVVEVVADGYIVTITVNSESTNLGEALLNAGLVDGEQGPYGLYVKKVNGITADYDIDQSYWAFYINGELAMTGIDGEEIQEGAIYRLEYTK